MELLFGQSLWSVWDACRARGRKLRLRDHCLDRRAGRRRPSLCPRAQGRPRAAAGHRASRRQRDEYLRDVRRRDQSHRFRTSESRRSDIEDRRRHRQRQGGVHVAGAGRGRPHRPAHRCLRSRDDALGARVRSTPLQGHRRRRDAQAGARRGRAGRDEARRRLSSGALESHRPRARARPRQALSRRREPRARPRRLRGEGAPAPGDLDGPRWLR